MFVRDLLNRAERVDTFDQQSAAAARLVRRILGKSPGISGLLRGSWLGHPVHPLAVTVPIGAWVSAPVLELAFDQPETARRVVGFGLLATVPAITAGLADLAGLGTAQRRVAALHALSNGLPASCFLIAYVRRSRHGHPAGRLWAGLGLATVSIGGALGGHLSYAQGAGVYRWQD